MTDFSRLSFERRLKEETERAYEQGRRDFQLHAIRFVKAALGKSPSTSGKLLDEVLEGLGVTRIKVKPDVDVSKVVAEENRREIER